MQWFSYYSPVDNQYHLYELYGAEEKSFPSQMGLPLKWDPLSRSRVLFQDTFPEGNETRQHTFLVSLTDDSIRDISNETSLNIQNTLWSQEENIIFALTYDIGAIPYSQFYKIDIETGSKQVVTAPIAANLLNFDELIADRYLLFEQSGLIEKENMDGLWVADLKKGTLKQRFSSGFQPKWLVWR